MHLQIKNVLNVPGTSEQLDFCVSDEQLARVKDYIFSSPVRVTGSVENRAGVVTLAFRSCFSLLVTCDRCLRETEQDFAFESNYTVVRRLDSEEDADQYVIAQAECIDPEEIAVTDLLLQLPTKMLCREDCKGLCPVCGCDRNETDCNCFDAN